MTKMTSPHHARLPRAVLTGFSLIGLFAGTIGLWAATSTLSGAVVAGGQFVVETNDKKVQHPTGGTEAVSTADLATGKVGTGKSSFDVTKSLQAWSDGA